MPSSGTLACQANRVSIRPLLLEPNRGLIAVS